MTTPWIQQAAVFQQHPFYEDDLPLAALQVDIYQRDLRNDWVSKIVSNFNAAEANAIHVSRRSDGSYWIIDGQHTHAALAKVGITSWICRVHQGLTLQEEAEMFRLMNKHSHRPNAMNDFKAALVQGDPMITDIDTIIGQFGIYIKGSHQVPGTLEPISAVTGFTGTYRLGGTTLLQAAMSVCSQAWPTPTYKPSETYNARLLPGIGQAILRSTKPFSTARLVTALQPHKPPVLEQQYARGQKGHDKSVANMVVDFYNGDQGALKRLRSNSADRIELVKGRSGKKPTLLLP